MSSSSSSSSSRPLFSTPGSVYRRLPYRRSPSTESEDEMQVDRTCLVQPGSSRAYRYAAEEEAEEVLEYARGAWEEADGAGYGHSEADDDHDQPPDGGARPEPEEEGPEELREIKEEDGDYAHVHHRPLNPGGDEAEEEEEVELPDERQCRICFSGVEEEATMGRLISPCLCSGSMRYVHVQCINAWRGTGTNARAFMECPQCKHRYTLRRTLISGLASSRPILLLLSTILFLLLSLASGHILHSYLLRSPKAQKQLVRSKRIRTAPTLFDMFQEDWDTFDNGVIIIGGGGALIWDVVLGSIQTFTDVANRLVLRQEGFLTHDLGLPEWAGTLITGMGIRFMLGLAVLGSLSFLSLLMSLSLFAPLHLANNLRGTGLFNRRRGGEDRGTAAGQLMIILFVLIGAVNTLVTVYRLTERIAQRMLRYVETQILEVNPEERRRAKRRRRRTWYEVWWKEGRWARREGWEEVRVRLWMGAREGLGPVWERMWARGENPAIQ